MGAPLFLTREQALHIRERFGAPVFVYSEAILDQHARETLAFPYAGKLTVRYAMKALPTAAILQCFSRLGLHIDASSGYEAERAMLAGIPAEHIQITAQQIPHNLAELVARGCLYNACSLRQLETYGQCCPGTEVSIRVNPGLGSGHSNRTNVGGPSSSFGIWHAYLEDALALAAKYRLRITGMHTHIGSGADPEVWMHCAGLSLNILARLPEATRFSLGGGFKRARMDHEVEADLQAIGQRLAPEFERFEAAHGRKLDLEIEPGTFLVAHAGVLLCSVADIVDTGADGYCFIKTDTGMNDILRPSIYGAQHPISLLPAENRDLSETRDYVVVGHCCESGDLLSPEPGNPEGLLPRTLPIAAPGDLLLIGGAGAYCASMASKNYNSFPESGEVLLTRDGSCREIRRRQTLAQLLQNEIQ